MVSENLLQLKARISVITSSCARSEGPVSLLAVSKTKSVSDIEEAIRCGQYMFGENYVQEAVDKIKALTAYPSLEWHYIGRIQKNKIKFLAEYFDWVQTLSDQAEAEKLNMACAKLNKKMNVCIQVNVSDESQKSGLVIPSINALATFIVTSCPYLCLRGLMSIGLATDDTILLRKMFHTMRKEYDSLKSFYPSIDTLSMGMTADMELAIEAGSTMVRVGTAIFGGRDV